MLATVGVRELKNETSRIVRTVHKENIEYVITVRGEPVAVLRPFGDEDVRRLRKAKIDAELAEMKRLAHQVAAAWQSSKSGVELVDQQRR
jgi:prevent-host-death family protein